MRLDKKNLLLHIREESDIYYTHRAESLWSIGGCGDIKIKHQASHVPLINYIRYIKAWSTSTLQYNWDSILPILLSGYLLGAYIPTWVDPSGGGGHYLNWTDTAKISFILPSFLPSIQEGSSSSSRRRRERKRMMRRWKRVCGDETESEKEKGGIMVHTLRVRFISSIWVTCRCVTTTSLGSFGWQSLNMMQRRFHL